MFVKSNKMTLHLLGFFGICPFSVKLNTIKCNTVSLIRSGLILIVFISVSSILSYWQLTQKTKSFRLLTYQVGNFVTHLVYNASLIILFLKRKSHAHLLNCINEMDKCIFIEFHLFPDKRFNRTFFTFIGTIVSYLILLLTFCFTFYRNFWWLMFDLNTMIMNLILLIIILYFGNIGNSLLQRMSIILSIKSDNLLSTSSENIHKRVNLLDAMHDVQEIYSSCFSLNITIILFNNFVNLTDIIYFLILDLARNIEGLLTSRLVLAYVISILPDVARNIIIATCLNSFGKQVI